MNEDEAEQVLLPTEVAALEAARERDAAGNLHERLTEVLNTTLVKPDGSITTATDLPWDRHDKHRFLYNCAVCQGNIPAIITAVVAELAGDPGDLPARMAEAIRDANGTPEALAWWEQHPQLIPAHVYAAAAVSVRWEHAAQQATELAEIKRVTDPPGGNEEMPTDPAELRELWEFINRQARWQHHMAHKFGSQVERLRAELAETREELDLQRDIAKTGDGWQQRAENAEAERNALKAAIASLKDDALFVARHAEENAWPDSDVAVKARRLLTALVVPESNESAMT